MTRVIKEPILYEKIRDIMLEMSSPSPQHLKVQGNINHYLYDLIDNTEEYEMLFTPNLYIDPNNFFIPDILICKRNQILDNNVYGTPEIVFEVLSPTTKQRDLKDKFEVYFECELPEYWVVNPMDKLVDIYIKGKLVDSYSEIKGGLIRSFHLPFVELTYEQIFRKVDIVVYKETR